MSSTAAPRRGAVLRSVEEASTRRLDGTLPTDVPGVTAVFRDDLELVGIKDWARSEGFEPLPPTVVRLSLRDRLLSTLAA